MEEIFKKYYYEGYITNYSVSNTGKVRNDKTMKLLKMKPNKKGYIRVGIYLRGEDTVKRVSVHVMVAETFIGPKPDDNFEIDHVDGNKSNNNVSNLEWVTRSENIKRAFMKELKKPIVGSEHPVSVYTDEQVHKLCMLASQGNSVDVCARISNIPKSYAYSILRGENWTHISSLYDLTKINKKFQCPNNIKEEIYTLIKSGMKKSKIIKSIKEKYGLDVKHVVYNYRK